MRNAAATRNACPCAHEGIPRACGHTLTPSIEARNFYVRNLFRKDIGLETVLLCAGGAQMGKPEITTGGSSRMVLKRARHEVACLEDHSFEGCPDNPIRSKTYLGPDHPRRDAGGHRHLAFRLPHIKPSTFGQCSPKPGQGVSCALRKRRSLIGERPGRRKPVFVCKFSPPTRTRQSSCGGLARYTDLPTPPRVCHSNFCCGGVWSFAALFVSWLHVGRTSENYTEHADVPRKADAGPKYVLLSTARRTESAGG